MEFELEVSKESAAMYTHLIFLVRQAGERRIAASVDVVDKNGDQVRFEPGWLAADEVMAIAAKAKELIGGDS